MSDTEIPATGEVERFESGGYRFVRAVFQYSAGVAAEPGFRLRRVRFREPLPLQVGFAAAETIMARAGRPRVAFAACELRSPAPFTDEGFRAFNLAYVGTLERWGVFDGETNPVARSNVCPKVDPPTEPSMFAFTFTEVAADAPPSFHIAGSGEAREGEGTFAERTVRFGETSPAAMADKARFVLAEMERRMSLLGFGWHDATAVQVYCVHDIHSFLEPEIARRGAARNGIDWHYCAPPVAGLEFEMDCRAVEHEQVVNAS
jgi:hypothetical protein